jgi:hypothetical protein
MAKKKNVSLDSNKMMITAAIVLVVIIILDRTGVLSYVGLGGNMVTETRTVQAFDSINLICSADVYITQDGTNTVEVEADENVIDLISTDVSDGMLIITMLPTTTIGRVRVYVTMDEVTSLNTVSSGDIIGQTQINADDLSLTIGSSGNMDLDINVETLTTRISSSGSMTLTGTVPTHTATLSSSGRLNAYNLITESTIVSVGGSGDANIYASSELDATVMSSGDINYKGNPTIVNEQDSSSGSINAR